MGRLAGHEEAFGLPPRAYREPAGLASVHQNTTLRCSFGEDHPPTGRKMELHKDTDQLRRFQMVRVYSVTEYKR